MLEAWKSCGGAEASRSKEFIDSSFGVFEVDAAQGREFSRIQELDERLQRLTASLHSASNSSTYGHIDMMPLNSSVQSSSRAFQYQPTRRQFAALPATQVLQYPLFIRLRCVCCQHDLARHVGENGVEILYYGGFRADDGCSRRCMPRPTLKKSIRGGMVTLQAQSPGCILSTDSTLSTGSTSQQPR